MTLILSCLTPKYIVQVSDRRLTWSDGRVANDSANKAILFHGKACFAYTGIAQIGSQRTDEWIANHLIEQTGLQNAIDALKRALDEEIHQLRAPNKHLTIVIDLWGTQDPDFPARPWSIALTNYIDPVTRKFCERPMSTFQQFNQTLPEDKVYAFLPSGQNLDMGIYRSMVRNVVRAMRHAALEPTTIQPRTLSRFVEEAILKVASGNRTVGTNLMTTILLNHELPENHGISNTFYYRHSDKSDPIIYAPTVISPTFAVRDLRIYPGPPRFAPK